MIFFLFINYQALCVVVRSEEMDGNSVGSAGSAGSDGSGGSGG